MPNIELHRPGIEPGPPLIECGCSTIELWNLYIIWVCSSYITSQYFSPNANYWTESFGNRTRAPLIECGRSTIELRNLYIIWVCCARDNLRGQKRLGPLKMSLEMAHKVIVPQKKIMSRSFLNSGTLIVITSTSLSLLNCHLLKWKLTGLSCACRIVSKLNVSPFHRVNSPLDAP